MNTLSKSDKSVSPEASSNLSPIKEEKTDTDLEIKKESNSDHCEDEIVANPASSLKEDVKGEELMECAEDETVHEKIDVSRIDAEVIVNTAINNAENNGIKEQMVVELAKETREDSNIDEDCDKYTKL